ncbi:MAG: hypothetical protein C0501_26230 [Isosphaera sp.]|nr:hypothetical protein [Isosphaera sp.]
MTFTVVWLPIALTMLADLWTVATDRAAITAASHRLDQRLAADPLNEGESRDGDERIAFEPPLQILFRVDPAAHVVTVTSVGRFGRP